MDTSTEEFDIDVWEELEKVIDDDCFAATPPPTVEKVSSVESWKNFIFLR